MSILRLAVVLEGVEPGVTRTLMVPSELRLDRLHLVLQAAMGWRNMHLYEFAAGRLRWGLSDPDLGLDILPAGKARLQEALAAAGTTPLRHTYDFGDDWHHLITAAPTDGFLPGPCRAPAGPALPQTRRRPGPMPARGRRRGSRPRALPGNDHEPQTCRPQRPDQWHGGPFDPSDPQTDKLHLDVLKPAKRRKLKKT